MIYGVVKKLDQRTGAGPFLKKTLRYVFPDHWSFLLGEVALYSFMILIVTGIYLTFFFRPDLSPSVYHGSYAPLHGMTMSEAYRSVVHISFDVKAGLLIRQTHHWAANVFVASIVLHLFRIFFTGAYRKPRELTYLIGLIMLFTVLLEGYLGYSLVDDLLSGMGLAIGYGVALSIPFFGANLAAAIWGAPFPGGPQFESRMYIAHVLLLPVMIGVLISVHLALVASRHHTQFRRKPKRQTNKRLLGLPTFPGQTPRSLGLMVGTAAILFLLGGLAQINPVWLWGPFHVADATNGAQPDWYLGWLIGALRLMPGFDVTVGSYTLVPNPFWGGILFPLIVLVALAVAPWFERRVTKDYGYHNIADRPRDAPRRTAFGFAFISWVFLIFYAGAGDRIYYQFGWDYPTQIWVYRGLVIVLPLVVYFFTKKICRELKQSELIEQDREHAEDEAKLDRGPPRSAVGAAPSHESS